MAEDRTPTPPEKNTPGEEAQPSLEGEAPAGTQGPLTVKPPSPLPSGEAAGPDDAAGREEETTAGEEDGKQGLDRQITFWQGVREVVVILLLAAIVAIFIQSFIVKAFIVPSSSMSPTLQVGDRIMADRMTYYFRKPKRGDIVVWRYAPDDPRSQNTTNLFYWPVQQILETLHLAHRGTTPYVKRVIATEGEKFQMKKGQVYIDDKPVNEPYAVKDYSDFGPVKVPKGMFYGLGDNRPNSRDSRFFGPIPYRNIIGRVFLRWWPPSRFGRPLSPSGN
jgi:signal peptidase I